MKQSIYLKVTEEVVMQPGCAELSHRELTHADVGKHSSDADELTHVNPRKHVRTLQLLLLLLREATSKTITHCLCVLALMSPTQAATHCNMTYVI